MKGLNARRTAAFARMQSSPLVTSYRNAAHFVEHTILTADVADVDVNVCGCIAVTETDTFFAPTSGQLTVPICAGADAHFADWRF
jgi:hypothetical protein